MRLLWVFPSLEIGGVQRRFMTLARGLGENHEHIVAAMDGNYTAMSSMGETVQWRKREIDAALSRFFSRANITNFREVLQSEEPDILITSNWGTLEWRLSNRAVRVPHLHFEDGFSGGETASKRFWRRDMARRFCFMRPVTGHDRYLFVAPSKAMREIFASAWSVEPGRIEQLVNAIDVDQFAADRLHSKEGPITIGSVGRLTPEKRYDRLLAIMAALVARRNKASAPRLLLVGDGPERAALEQEAIRLGIQEYVEFVGGVSNVAEQLQRFDIFALSSDTEQAPVSLIEAMAAGLPVLATDVGDIRAMVTDANRAFICDPDDGPRYGECAERLLADESLRTNLGALNREKARHEHSLDRMVSSFNEILVSLATS